MKIAEKMKMDLEGFIKNGPINIVAFGDSVTQGCVGPGEVDYESVYWARLRRKLQSRGRDIPINTINAGIGGITAKDSLPRLEKQVLIHEADLVIVSFGLNDVNGELDDYLGPMHTIFEECAKSGSDVIFMSPNMLNTYVAKDADPKFIEYAHKTADMQNSGRMDRYITAACDLARRDGIPVCDLYAEWKKMSETQDTTLMLANRINHPLRRMHEIPAEMLLHMLLG